MTDSVLQLERMVSAVLANEELPTPERIRELIDNVRRVPILSAVTDKDAEDLARILEERHGVTMRIGAQLVGKRWEPWLDAARPQITPYYWGRYRQLLVQKGFSGHVIATLDRVTDRVLGLLENPHKPESWDRRGMVVGHVQSGKTANYAALICKAADAGYRLVVVIAGVHNNLRNQTQLRMDEGFVGWDSARLLTKKPDQQQLVGVGRFDLTRRPVTFTNSLRDFNKTTATGVGVPLRNLTEPALFVIKKNSSTLRNLLEWLREHNARAGRGRVDAPMLLIDDEADNASINTRQGQGEVTRINSQIRDLLRMFERSCYVGYTATPFANIFIDPDTDDEMLGADLFPKDFIISLDPPSNYFGASRVFTDMPEAVVRHIDDNEDLLPVQHRIDWHVTALPDSLKTALRTFVVARAIRISRGHTTEHNSMLVNASRFTGVQHQLRNELHQELEDIKAGIRVHGALPPEQSLKDHAVAALHQAWRDEYEATTEFSWDVIQANLISAAAPISVVEINSGSAETLNYADHEKSGLSVVAVGGFSLSRGLTLEGLIVSYFLRNSVMYDTLMQMGRWFGFRPGYEDLCRIWMPEEAEGWYAHIADSIEELREELRLMEAANATPEEFGLKVRSHPDTLMVTARNKMGTGELVRVKIGLANKFVETAILRSDDSSLNDNREAVRRLAARLTAGGSPPSSAKYEAGAGWLLRGVPVGPIEEFVAEFRNHVGSMLTDPGPLRRYIQERAGGELATWDVLFASITTKEDRGLEDNELLGIPINCQRRARGRSRDGDQSTVRVTNKQRVASRGVERIGLTPEQVTDAQREYREREHKGSDAKEPNYPDRIYRAKRERPLLIVHLLAIGSKSDDLSVSEPYVAYSISFPDSKTEEKRVEYVVNTTWLRENYRDDLDEDEMGGDSDDE